MMLLLVKNINSTDKLLKDYPYIVGIGFIVTVNDVHIDINSCTGSLVRANWVVTAGDCIAEEKKYFVSYVSYNDAAPSVSKIEVIERFLHPGYKRPTFATNIGLIIVAEVSVPVLPKLSLKDYSQSFGASVVYIGFWTKADGTKSDRLEIGEFDISPCISVTKSLICTLNKYDNTSSHTWFTIGGALIQEDALIGLYVGKLNSYIESFAPIRINLDWIDQIIEENIQSLRFSVALSLDLDEKRDN